MALTARDIVIASQLAGQFTLPEDTNEKLVFIAGGIGITPFRSMAKYLIDTKERRDIILIYACLAAKDFVYTNVFKDAEAYGFKTVYLVTDATEVPADFHCETGYLTPELAHKLIPDLKERSYYLSGPDAMVRSYLRLFLGLGVSARRIKKDYFPGF